MTTLLQAQKTLNVTPVVSASIGGVTYTSQVGRYKYYETANSYGRAFVWLDNSLGQFDTRPANIARGQPVIITRGLQVGGQNLTQVLPTVWIESYMYKRYKDEPYLVLDCIDWIGRLRYFRWPEEQVYEDTEVQTIVEDTLAEVGLTLDSGSFTSLSLDYTIWVSRSGWSTIKELMSRIPEVLFAKPGGVVGFKTLDPDEAAGYDYGFAPTDKHPMLEDSSAAGATPKYNKIIVLGGSDLEYSGTATDEDEYALLGYYRTRTIKDRKLSSNDECETRAEAELGAYQAKSVSGVVVSRPHFTIQLYDVVSAEASPGGASAEIEAGHVTKIVEWYQFANRIFDQALTVGEVPDALVVTVSDPSDDPGEAPEPPEEQEDEQEDTDEEEEVIPSDESVDTDQLADGSVTTAKLAADAVTGAKIANDSIDSEHYVDGSIDNAHLADNSISNAKMQNDSITAAEIAAGAVDTSELAADAVDGTKIADNSIGNEHMQNDAITGAELADNSIDSEHYVDGSIDSVHLAADAVDGTKIADDAVDSEHIADGAVDPAHLATFPKCRVYRSTTVQTVTNNTEAAVQWNDESFDTDSMHSTVTNNTRITAQTAGYYRAYTQLYLYDRPLDSSTEVYIRKNGSTELARYNHRIGSLEGEDYVWVVATMGYLSVSDYVEVIVDNNDSNPNDTDIEPGEARSFCEVWLIP